MTAAAIAFAAFVAAMFIFIFVLVLLLLWVITGLLVTIPLWIIVNAIDGCVSLVERLATGLRRRWA